MSHDSQESKSSHPRVNEDPLGRSVTVLQSIFSSDERSKAFLQHTREYRNFIQALEQLELVHRNVSTTWNDARDVSSGSCAPSVSFLQYIATDDMIFRIFSYLECVTLVNVGTSCTRLRELANAHAIERSRPLVTRGQISSPMKLLKAYEQVMMGDYAWDNASSQQTVPIGVVPIPALLLPKCIRVRDCGDTEYNGIYYCTGCNGNGYVFTKPRYPMQQRPVNSHTDSTPPGHIDDLDTADCRGAECGQPLRCIIAKRFSEETLLWYMSKEVLSTIAEDDLDAADSATAVVDHGSDPIIRQQFSFWATLMVLGSTDNGDWLSYPSFSSRVDSTSGRIHRLRDASEWESLSTTAPTTPPIVELID